MIQPHHGGTTAPRTAAAVKLQPVKQAAAAIKLQPMLIDAAEMCWVCNNQTPESAGDE
jgi:hypothetical protein